MNRTEEKGLSISARSFLAAILVILVLMIAAYILTLVIPSGVYARTENAAGDLVPPGQGIVDFRGVADVCRQIGVEYAFAEQERWEGDPFQRLKEGFDWVKMQ